MVDELGSAGRDTYALLEQATARLRSRVPFDRCTWLLYDPEVMLPTGALDIGDTVSDEVRLAHCANEQLEDDVHKFRHLARQPVPVGVLNRNQPEQRTSRRVRELLQPRGVEHELRAALLFKGACWGSLTLERSRPAPGFRDAEAGFVQGIGEALAHGIARDALAVRPSRGMVQPPGVVIIDTDGRLASANDPAAYWLDILQSGSPPVTDGLPLAVAGLAMRTLAARNGPVRVRANNGQWVTLHGTLMHDGGRSQDRVCVTMQSSRSGELLPLVGRFYRLTPREQSVIGLVLSGLSTRRVSERLRISEHTVQDHLKSIFEKTGVHSRRELAHQVALQLFRLPERESPADA